VNFFFCVTENPFLYFHVQIDWIEGNTGKIKAAEPTTSTSRRLPGLREKLIIGLKKKKKTKKPTSIGSLKPTSLKPIPSLAPSHIPSSRPTISTTTTDDIVAGTQVLDFDEEFVEFLNVDDMLTFSPGFGYEETVTVTFILIKLPNMRTVVFDKELENNHPKGSTVFYRTLPSASPSASLSTIPSPVPSHIPSSIPSSVPSHIPSNRPTILTTTTEIISPGTQSLDLDEEFVKLLNINDKLTLSPGFPYEETVTVIFIEDPAVMKVTATRKVIVNTATENEHPEGSEVSVSVILTAIPSPSPSPSVSVVPPPLSEPPTPAPTWGDTSFIMSEPPAPAPIWEDTAKPIILPNN